MRKVFDWFWRDKVSTILLILIIMFVVAYTITGKNFTGFLILTALYVVVAIVEKGKLMDAMNENIQDPDVREFFNLPVPGYRKPKPTLFAWLVNAAILLGTLVILVVAFLYLIDRI